MLTYSVARGEERHQASKLIQQVFAGEMGLTTVGPDEFEAEATFLVASHEGRVVAAVRIIRDSAKGLPVERLTDVSLVRNQGGQVMEASRLACAPTHRHRRIVERGLPFFLDVLAHLGADHVVLESLPRAVGLYRRLGFVPVGAPISDPALAPGGIAPLIPNAVLMHLRLRDQVCSAVFEEGGARCY